MKYFYLPITQNIIEPSNIIIDINNTNSIIMSFSINHYLNVCKNKINLYSSIWDDFKKYTNQYEFIHTQIPLLKNSVSKIKPLSRSYFKLIEIINSFNLLKDIITPIETFHLAEGPGGFIEAIAHIRKNPADRYTGITLIDTDSSIPNWNKCKDVMKKYPNIIVEFGKDGTGDILSPSNLKHCYEKYANKMELITGDGGFDFSIDFNNQESLASNLLFAEVCYAILLQKKSGSFVVKFFDIFHNVTLQLLYLLNSFYSSVIITKPLTSRPANSEKYIVCNDFKYSDTSHFFNVFYQVFQNNNLKTCHLFSILNIQLPYIFKIKVEEVNTVLAQNQIENINQTIDFINLHSTSKTSEKMDTIKKKHVAKCVEWCIKNSIPYNTTYIYNNYYEGINKY